MQAAITWIYIDQDLRRHIAWFAHNEFSPKADFRIVLGNLIGLLVESDGWLQMLWSSILGLSSHSLKLNFSLSHPENLISYLIHYRLICPGQILLAKHQSPNFIHQEWLDNH